uniref:Uncharacterized protein n=1 Tax=Anopheles minimus TaxID=112268 RepID=A0A182W381_9DIPT
MNSSLVPSTGNSNSCMERYVNRYVVHQQPPHPHHHPVHSQVHLQPGTSSVAASAVAAGYYHQTAHIHPHHQLHPPNQRQQQTQGQFIALQTHNHPAQHPNPSVLPPSSSLAQQAGTTGNNAAASNFMVGCYGGAGSVGTSGWTGVPLISTASSNRRHRKHFTGSGVPNNGNHYPYQQQLAQQQQHYNLTKGTSSGMEFDENANLTRLALHAQGAPLILSNTSRYHHGHHRNLKSSLGAAHQSAGNGVGSAKAVTIGGSQIPLQESSTNCSTRSSAQLPHPGQGCNVGQRRLLDAHPTIVGAGGQSGGGIIKSYEAVASLDLIPSNGNTNTPSTVMSGSAMSSSVSSSSSSSTSSASSATSSVSTEMCLPRIIKPRKRRKKDRKPNGQTTIGGVVSAGNGDDPGMCLTSDSANSGCAAGSLPCLESHLLHVGSGSNVHTVNNILLQHQQSPLHCSPASMESFGSGAANVRDILNELSYLASHNPSVLFPERLTLSPGFGSANSSGAGTESNDASNAMIRHQTVPFEFLCSSDMNTAQTESTLAQVSNSSPSISTPVSVTEPTSPSASSTCSCRMCDPFGRIWAFPMLRHSSCSSTDGFEAESRKKNVGVIGSNRSSGTALRGTWCTSAESVSLAPLNLGDSPDDGCLSRKGSFSDSGSDSGCDLLLSRLPGLCSTEEEEEDDDEEEHETRTECVGQGEESDSLLSSTQIGKNFTQHYGDLPWLGAIVRRPVISSEVSSCPLKTNDDELLLMSELTKKLHETLDLVGETSSNQESIRIRKESADIMGPRSGSCSSSSSTSDNSSGMGSLIGGDSSPLSPPSDVFVGFDAMSRSNMFDEKSSIGQRLLMGGDRLFNAGNECLVMDESDMRTSEMLKSSATNAYQMVSFKGGSIASAKCEGIEAGSVSVENGGCVTERGEAPRCQGSSIVQCEKRNPLSLRPISVVGSLFSMNQQKGAPSGGSSWNSTTTDTGSSSCLFGGEQHFVAHQQQLQRQPSTAGGIGDMLNCFDTFWRGGGDHKQLLPSEE